MAFEESNQQPCKKEEQACSAAPERPRRAYTRLKIEALGDVRDVTLGGSPGVGESGMSMTRKP